MGDATRDPVPGGTSNLRRESLNPPHWRQARRVLMVEAAVLAAIAVAGLVTALVRGTSDGVSVLGLSMPPVLSLVLLGVAAAAAVAATRRHLAIIFTPAAALASVFALVICAVAAVHDAGGPLGFSVPDILLYAGLVAFNLALFIWLIPDRLEGPAWVPTTEPPDNA